MVSNHSKLVGKIGFYSAMLSTIFSIAYIVAQAADLLGLLGPSGGPVSLIFLMAPSIFLASSFVILMISIHYYASEEKKIWSHIGLIFATIYAVLISIVYYTQLTWVIPHMLQGTEEQISAFIFKSFDSFLYAVDVLGYSFMSLSTLFAAPVFVEGRLERTISWFLIANGLLIPFLSLQMYYPALIYGAALWVITFPTSTILLAMLFRRYR